MSKKIIFIGPPGAGKTTLRKIFFEGENATKLLEYSLAPTRGQESIILKLREKIGIFDLAGQEINKWFEINNSSVFYNTKVVIVVIEANTTIEDIIKFLENVDNVRNKLSPFAKIYLLIHKIDLLNSKDLEKLEKQLKEEVKEVRLLKIVFTSIKKEFFIPTFSVFIEILENSLKDESTFNKIDFDALDYMIRVIYHIDKEVVVLNDDLIKKVNVPPQILNEILIKLLDNRDIRVSNLNGKITWKLTLKGRRRYNAIIKDFMLTNIKYLKEQSTLLNKSKKLKIPPVLGFMISDKNGKILILIENEKDIIENFFKRNLEGKIEGDFSIELIPMFFSALEKFSSQFNFKDISKLNFEGMFINIQLFQFESFNITFFFNPDINLNPLKEEISMYFKEFFRIYHKELEIANKNFFINATPKLNKVLADWHQEINARCEKMLINLELFDFEKAKKIYADLDEIFDEMNLKHKLTVKKIKELKLNLIKAILNQDHHDINIIFQKIRDLKLTYLPTL